MIFAWLLLAFGGVVALLGAAYLGEKLWSLSRNLGFSLLSRPERRRQIQLLQRATARDGWQIQKQSKGFLLLQSEGGERKIELRVGVREGRVHLQCAMHCELPMELEISHARAKPEEDSPASLPIDERTFLPDWSLIPSYFGDFPVTFSAPIFAPALVLKGDEKVLLACFSMPHCARINELFRVFDFRVKEGEILYAQEGFLPGLSEIELLLSRMDELCALLHLSHASCIERLLGNVQRHDSLFVRYRSLELLPFFISEDPRLLEVQRWALEELPLQGKLIAAMGLGKEATGFLVEGMVHRRFPPRVERQLLPHLLANMSLDEAFIFLDRCLQEQRSCGSSAPHREAHLLREYGGLGEGDAVGNFKVGYLKAYLAHPSLHPEVVKAIAESLIRYGGEGCEEALLPLLSKPNSRIQCIAADALGALGTPQSILPLSRCLERAKPEDRAVFRGALAGIQQRCSHLNAGSLAVLSDPEHEGALSTLPNAGGLSTFDNA